MAKLKAAKLTKKQREELLRRFNRAVKSETKLRIKEVARA